MKQISQNYKTGAVQIESVNVPALRPGGVLVQTMFSVVSAGTEGMKVKEGKMSYLGKARARPDQVKKVIQSLRQQGFMATYRKVMNKLDSLTPLGYSLSGTVVAVGRGAEEFQVGQRVACAGAGYANHAEINFVPKNLVVPVPENVLMEHAAFATVGAIAMQGFRRAEMQLGETACVIGLGLLGQLLVQLLRAAGVHVIGIDIVDGRCLLAEKCGAVFAARPDDPGLLMRVRQVTAGIGVDCTFITAGGNTNQPVELACEISRDRGRLVDVGKTRLDLPWNDYYMKELDVRFSRSYGPGRYDPNYEEKGIDYPAGYVRWTERRNMASVIDLIAGKRLDLSPIVTEIRPFAEAEKVYQELAGGRTESIGIVFRHAEDIDMARRMWLPEAGGSRRKGSRERVRLGVIGAGSYASSMLLPHLAKNRDVELREVATATSLSAADAARKFGFARATTDYREILRDDDIDAVIIVTRHGSHAPMVAEALISGKTVYVEKPLAIDIEGLRQVRAAITESGNDRLMVGFNRRFSPLVKEVARIAGQGGGPLVMNYRVHAGQIDRGSWYLDTSSHGTRFVGEAGHFFDVLSFVAGSRPVSVMARSLRPSKVTQDDLENIAAVVQYENGSIGNLLYLTQGGTKVPKEFLEVFGGGRTIQLHNFEYLLLYEGDGHRSYKAGALDKGQREEMERFVSAVKEEVSVPIPVESLFDTTLATLAAAESARSGQAVLLSEYGKEIWD